MQESTTTLRSLRDRPFELLAELERRGRSLTGSAGTEAASDGEWVGVALKMAGELYLVAREEAREVLGVPTPLTRVPGAKSWVLGLANVRGQLLPIIDLRAYLGGGETPAARTARIIVVNHRDIPAGLVVDEVLGFRRFTDAEFGAEVPPTIVNCARYIAGSFRRASERWPVLGLRALVEDGSFLEASA
jgi:twitching motility protein PilI